HGKGRGGPVHVSVALLGRGVTATVGGRHRDLRIARRPASNRRRRPYTTVLGARGAAVGQHVGNGRGVVGVAGRQRGAVHAQGRGSAVDMRGALLGRGVAATVGRGRGGVGYGKCRASHRRRRGD